MRILKVLILPCLLILAACVPPHPSSTPPTQTTTQYPADGTVLSIESVQGSGNGWTNEIKLSDATFTFGYLDSEVNGLAGPYKVGDPTIYLSGILTNISAQDWEVRLSTVEVTTLDYCGIWGGTCAFIRAGESASFKVPLEYKPLLSKITVNIQVSTIPFP
ncbi:MAG: hypothetical protein TUN42_08355 [Dehalogenimonas sp.]